jgi:hypothetical protein
MRPFFCAFGLLLALVAAPALAHQPVLAPLGDHGSQSPIAVKDPEVSKAYFGQLTGKSAYYRIVSAEPFRFYAGITAPKIDNCPLTTRFSFDVLDGDMKLVAAADGESFAWWPWYENFGKKWYWVGPEIGAKFKSTRTLPAGTYTIRVFNAENSGRYVLAVGDEESFPLDVIVKTMLILPGINRDFWDSADCSAR